MKVKDGAIEITMYELMEDDDCRKLAIEYLASDTNLIRAMCKRLADPRDEIEGSDWWGFQTGEVRRLCDAAREHLLAVANESARQLAENAIADRKRHYEECQKLTRENYDLKHRVQMLQQTLKDYNL